MAGHDEDDVGYGRPPKATRFKKGQSGNPKGRPKNARRKGPSLTVMEKVLRNKLEMSFNGRRKRVSIAEAVAYQMVDQSSRGKFGATRHLVMAQKEIEAAASAARASETSARPISLSAIVNQLEVLDCLYVAGLIYIRRDGTFVFERDSFEQMTAHCAHQLVTRKDLTFTLGTQAEDPDAMPMIDGQLLVDVYDLLDEGQPASEP